MNKLLTILLVLCLTTSIVSAKPMFEFNLSKIKEDISNTVNKFTNRNIANNQAQTDTNTANIDPISLQTQYNTNTQIQLQTRLNNLNTQQNINAVSNELQKRNINISCARITTDDSEYYLKMNEGLVNICNPVIEVDMSNNEFEQIIIQIENSLKDNKITYIEMLKLRYNLRNIEFRSVT